MTKPNKPRFNPTNHFTPDELNELLTRYQPKPAADRSPDDWELADLLGTNLNPVGEDLDSLSLDFRCAAAWAKDSNFDDAAPGSRTAKSGKTTSYRGYSLHAVVSHGTTKRANWKQERREHQKWLTSRTL